MSLDPRADPERRKAISRSVERRLRLQQAKGEASEAKAEDVSPDRDPDSCPYCGHFMCGGHPPLEFED